MPAEETGEVEVDGREVRRHRVRKRRTIGTDESLELRNTELWQMKMHYSSNMAEAWRKKLQVQGGALAKRKAEYLVLEVGVNGIGIGRGVTDMAGSLSMFMGRELLENLTGNVENLTGNVWMRRSDKRERDRDEDDGTDKNNKRIRADEGAAQQEDGDGYLDLRMEDYGVEVGRAAVRSMADEESSILPWNVTGAAPTTSDFSSALRGRGNLSGTSSGRGTSRARAAGSPLLGYGYGVGAAMAGGMGEGRVGELSRMCATTGRADVRGNAKEEVGGEEIYDLPEMQERSLQFLSEHESTGAAAVGEERGNRESSNFLAFVAAARKSDRGAVAFSDVIRPEACSRVVAAQGLLQVLTLATGGLLQVEQRRGFAAIEIRISPKGKLRSVI